MNRLSLRNNRLKIHQDCRKITDHVRGIYGIYPNLIKENLRMPTFNRFDLQTLGSRPIIMPKNLPGHCQCWTECRGLLGRSHFLLAVAGNSKYSIKSVSSKSGVQAGWVFFTAISRWQGVAFCRQGSYKGVG